VLVLLALLPTPEILAADYENGLAPPGAPSSAFPTPSRPVAGRTGGRPPKLTDDNIEAAKAMLANPDIGVTQIAHRLGVSPATLYRYIPAARTANAPDV
jgi:hypothetical protein